MKHLEEQIQVSFFEWLKLQHPKTAPYVFHVPNGEIRNKIQNSRGQWYCPSGVKLKRMGSKAGVADVFVMIPNVDFCGLWLEFKAPKGRQTLAQEAFQELALSMCYDYQIVYSLDEARKALTEYLQHPCHINHELED